MFTRHFLTRRIQDLKGSRKMIFVTEQGMFKDHNMSSPGIDQPRRAGEGIRLRAKDLHCREERRQQKKGTARGDPPRRYPTGAGIGILCIRMTFDY
jgi:hypothetical protein